VIGSRGAVTWSRLGRRAERPQEAPQERSQKRPQIGPSDGVERCGLCALPIAVRHRHLLDTEHRALRCACRACAILFDGARAGGARYRLVPERCGELRSFALGDADWDAFGIPVAIAFFFRSTAAGRVVAFYPSPMGAMESSLGLGGWDALVAANPALASMETDVEALLVNRARGAREHWLVPVDACYRLVGIVRTHWKGFGGGPAVWTEIARFFDTLREEESWQPDRTT